MTFLAFICQATGWVGLAPLCLWQKGGTHAENSRRAVPTLAESGRMKVICHGIDLVDCRRIERLRRDHGRRFLSRIFTERELRYCRSHRYQAERLGGRFAVKEAVMKMLGTGWQNGVAWTDIETVNDSLGKPIVRLSGSIARIAGELGIDQISVSITHTSDLAVASAIALGGNDDS